MRLVLFDIDGTLITDRGAARDAFRTALEAVYSYDGDLSRYDFSGRTDPQIARWVLREHGVADDVIDSRMSDLWHLYLQHLGRNATADRVRVLPGMRALVEALHEHEDVVLALLTGNIEQGARLKLGPAELNDYFPFGAFGSDSADRTELPPVAVERASAHCGHRFAGADVVIIGDSIYDVRCGVPWGATTIAVASGKTAADTLRAEDPTHFFESAEDWEAVVRVVVG